MRRIALLLLFVFGSALAQTVCIVYSVPLVIEGNVVFFNYATYQEACEAWVSNRTVVESNLGNVFSLTGNYKDNKSCGYVVTKNGIPSQENWFTPTKKNLPSGEDCPTSRCQQGDIVTVPMVGSKWLNNKTGFIVPFLPTGNKCFGRCEVTNITPTNNFRPKDSDQAKGDWKLIADDYTATKTGNICSVDNFTDPPLPESPPGMNCGFYNGHEVCISKDSAYVCKDINGEKACLPTSEINQG